MFIASAIGAAMFAAACGGGSSKSATSTPEAASSSTAAATVSRGTPPALSTPVAAATTTGSGQTGTTLTAEQAKTLIDNAVLMPKDLPTGWTIMGDTTQDNVAAATADPTHAGSIERCGRLLGRTVTNQPADVVTAYLGGETVSFFSTLTAYATAAGALDCSTETAQRYAQPGEFAKAFGQLFVDPTAVKITTVDYPQVGDASFAATLEGLINAAGTQVDLTILIVAFRDGNVTGAVGSAAQAAPMTTELKPYVDLVLQRVNAALQ
ncbi:MAG TPA: hypothetical protein VKJ07_18195 [Mycobacteriales bacterium]|nr:hypothetical protein [Mycobacteriales bacterium]